MAGTTWLSLDVTCRAVCVCPYSGVFTATRHHVELLIRVLEAEGVTCAAVYGGAGQMLPCTS